MNVQIILINRLIFPPDAKSASEPEDLGATLEIILAVSLIICCFHDSYWCGCLLHVSTIQIYIHVKCTVIYLCSWVCFSRLERILLEAITV